MNGHKQVFLFFILALLATAFVWGAQVTAADPGEQFPSEDTPTATSTPSPTVTSSPSGTPEATATVTATTAVTEPETPEATVTSEATATPIVNYLPVLADIPPPAPRGCEPLPHIPGVRPATETDMANLINAYRQNNGLHRLNVMPHLTQAARRHANDMAVNDVSNHTGSDGSSLSERVAGACYQWANIGEIMGVNDSTFSMFNAWVNTRGNNSLILAPEFQDIGVGYVYDPDTRYQHYWVVVFGRPLSGGLYEQTDLLLPVH